MGSLCGKIEKKDDVDELIRHYLQQSKEEFYKDRSKEKALLDEEFENFDFKDPEAFEEYMKQHFPDIHAQLVDNKDNKDTKDNKVTPVQRSFDDIASPPNI
jgi:hypothetical protein